jgi:DNA-binding CsgD family transcriptional regulator
MSDKTPTATEREIVLLLSQGKTLKEIAWERKRSLQTLYFQTKTLHQAHGTHTPAGLVAVFFRKGWII